MKHLIRADTNEQVTISMPPTRDGRVLVQHTDGGRLGVVNVKDVAVIDGELQAGAR